MNDATDAYGGAADRREESRRVVVIKPSGEEHRAGAERRAADDRRGFHANLSISDESAIQDIILWLDKNAGDGWLVGPNENEPRESDVTCRVRFETKEMLDTFTKWLNDI
ncbi:MAG: hypothetical protein HQ503_03130 [Rhodospirillales bacterium]|nr:hypothetical protein [Rhodospirillales bacterium]